MKLGNKCSSLLFMPHSFKKIVRNFSNWTIHVQSRPCCKRSCIFQWTKKVWEKLLIYFFFKQHLFTTKDYLSFFERKKTNEIKLVLNIVANISQCWFNKLGHSKKKSHLMRAQDVMVKRMTRSLWNSILI